MLRGLLKENLHDLLFKRPPKGEKESVAEIRRIQFRHKRNYFDCCHTDQFLTTHTGYCSPEAVLDDHVSLFGIDAEKAMFVVMPKTIQCYSAEKVPFIWMWLYKESQSVITMPLEAFHQLADSIGAPKTKLILGSHPGRVGSTVFSNMVHHLSPNIFSYSSHHSFYMLHNFKATMEPSEYDRMARSICHLAFKPLKGKTVFFTKGPCKTVDISADILRYVPNSIHIYLDRNPLDTIHSYERIFTQLYENRMLRICMFLNWLTGRWLFDMGGYHRKAQEAAIRYLRPTQFEAFSIIWASNQLYKREIVQQGIQTDVFMFEDYVTKGKETMQRFIEVCQLQNEAVDPENALKGLQKKDSQEGSAYSQKYRNFSVNTPMTQEISGRLDTFCNVLGMTRIAKEVSQG